MSRRRRIAAEAGAAWRGFRRRRTAVVFTFLFPLLLVLIFGALVRTGGGGDGLFAKPAGYYVAGYATVVVLFTPLTRVGSTVARYRAGNRFEKLATTPLSRGEWLLAHTAVNVVVVGAATGLILALVILITPATVTLSPVLIPLVVLAVTLFCGVGAVLGRLSDSRDGVVAASNTIALPLLFLSETFVPPALLPAWFRPAVSLSPVTYFARGVRAVTYSGEAWVQPLAILALLATIGLLAGTIAIPRTD